MGAPEHTCTLRLLLGPDFSLLAGALGKEPLNRRGTGLWEPPISALEAGVV